MIITTEKHFMFHNRETGEVCSVPRSPKVQDAKSVPDWVSETALFRLAVKEGSVKEIIVDLDAEPAKIIRPAGQVDVKDLLEDEVTDEGKPEKKKK